MKKLKKISALVLAVMMIAMAATVYAADTGDAYNGASQTTTTGASIPLTKTIVFINENSSPVYEPNITYSYGITTVNPGTASVTDADNDTARVNEGVDGGVTGTTIAFSSANDAAETYPTGNQVTKSSNLTVVFGTNGTATFQHAGIYRYLITETSNVTPASVGITRDATGYVATRYLDVYIGNGGTVDAQTNPLGLQLLGAVIFKTENTTNPGQDSIAHTDTNDQKTTGFEPGVADGTSGTTDYTSDTTVDRYTTYDFSVKKEVAGSLANKDNEFPFYVSVSNTINGAKYTFYDDPGTGTGAAEVISGTSITKGTNALTSTLTLKHGDFIKFVGVPSNTTAGSELSIDITEWNNTPDSYTPTVAATNGDTAMVSGAQMASDGSDSVDTFDLKTNDDASQILTITNTISEISPTGLVIRFAPYALILVAGLALLIIAMKRKGHKEEE